MTDNITHEYFFLSKQCYHAENTGIFHKYLLLMAQYAPAPSPKQKGLTKENVKCQCSHMDAVCIQQSQSETIIQLISFYL